MIILVTRHTVLIIFNSFLHLISTLKTFLTGTAPPRHRVPTMWWAHFWQRSNSNNWYNIFAVYPHMYKYMYWFVAHMCWLMLLGGLLDRAVACWSICAPSRKSCICQENVQCMISTSHLTLNRTKISKENRLLCSVHSEARNLSNLTDRGDAGLLLSKNSLVGQQPLAYWPNSFKIHKCSKVIVYMILYNNLSISVKWAILHRIVIFVFFFQRIWFEIHILSSIKLVYY